MSKCEKSKDKIVKNLQQFGDKYKVDVASQINEVESFECPKRKSSPYNDFVAEQARSGKNFSEISALWKKTKGGENNVSPVDTLIDEME